MSSSPPSDYEFVNDEAAKANNVASEVAAGVLSPGGDAPATATAAPPSPKAATPPAEPTVTPVKAGVSAPGDGNAAPAVAGSGSGSSASAGYNVADVMEAATAAYVRVQPYVDWKDPVRTGSAFVAVLSAYVLFHLIGFTVPVFLSYVAVASLAAAGAVVAVRPHFNVPVNFPPAAVSKDAFDGHSDAVLDGTKAAVTFAVNRYTEFRDVLTWQEPLVSVRALAVLLIVASNAYWLFTPTTLFVLALLAFALPVAYAKQASVVNAFVTNNVQPTAHTVGTKVAAVRSAVAPLHAALAFGLGLAVVLFMGFMSMCSFVLLSAWVLVLSDVLPSLRPKVQ